MKNIIFKIFVVLILFALKSPLMGQSLEYKVKAAFLERFTRFVDWPGSELSQSDSTDTFRITVIGTNPFDGALEEIYTNTRIKNKKVRINYISEISDIDSCHLLFISSAMQSSLDEILSYTNAKPILTVSDHGGFAERGVIINFFLENNKVRFEINEKSLIQSKLYMSYLLLNVATIVNKRTEKE